MVLLKGFDDIFNVDLNAFFSESRHILIIVTLDYEAAQELVYPVL